MEKDDGENRETRDDFLRSLLIVPRDEPQCIWMRAGVVNHKLCPHNYGCYHCLFDKALREKGVSRAGSRYTAGWQELLKRLPGPERWCRHMIQGLVTHKVCPNNYNCGTCEYDQMVQDRLGPVDLEERDVRRIAGFMVPDGFHYHPSHEWARVEYGGAVRVGFDDFASQMLGGDAEVAPPRVGQKFQAGKEAFRVKAAGRDFNVLAPLDGTVIAVNPLHGGGRRTGQLHPFEEGWVAMLEPDRKLQVCLKRMKWADKAVEWMQEEADSLFARLQTGTPTAADGGGFTPGFMDRLPADRRAGLIGDFLIR